MTISNPPKVLQSANAKQNAMPIANVKLREIITLIAAPRASNKLPSELTTRPSIYKSQQTFPSTTIRDDKSIPAPGGYLPASLVNKYIFDIDETTTHINVKNALVFIVYFDSV